MGCFIRVYSWAEANWFPNLRIVAPAPLPRQAKGAAVCPESIGAQQKIRNAINAILERFRQKSEIQASVGQTSAFELGIRDMAHPIFRASFAPRILLKGRRR